MCLLTNPWGIWQLNIEASQSADHALMDCCLTKNTVVWRQEDISNRRLEKFLFVFIITASVLWFIFFYDRHHMADLCNRDTLLSGHLFMIITNNIGLVWTQSQLFHPDVGPGFPITEWPYFIHRPPQLSGCHTVTTQCPPLSPGTLPSPRGQHKVCQWG